MMCGSDCLLLFFFFSNLVDILSSLPCIFGYLAINTSPHLSVPDVVSRPAVNRFITVTKRFSLQKLWLVIPDSCRRGPISALVMFLTWSPFTAFHTWIHNVLYITHLLMNMCYTSHLWCLVSFIYIYITFRAFSRRFCPMQHADQGNQTSDLPITRQRLYPHHSVAENHTIWNLGPFGQVSKDTWPRQCLAGQENCWTQSGNIVEQWAETFVGLLNVTHTSCEESSTWIVRGSLAYIPGRDCWDSEEAPQWKGLTQP